jgi:hypothetical protein
MEWRAYQTYKMILVRHRSKKGYCAININSNYTGIGARIISMFELMLYCDTQGLYPLFQFNYEGEKAETDYFNELFYYKNPPTSLPPSIKFTSVKDASVLYSLGNLNKKLSLSIAKLLFDKYLGFSNKIEDEVNSFTNQWFAGKKVLGIHYRGTDKVTEAPAVSLDTLRDKINLLLNKDTYNLIFLSTDTEGVLEYLTSSQFGVPIICREDALPKSADTPIHLSPIHSKQLIHHDAMVNCLILSRCRFLLKTTSFLSDLSVVFNPQLPVAVINRPYQEAILWPNSEINELALHLF